MKRILLSATMVGIIGIAMGCNQGNTSPDATSPERSTAAPATTADKAGVQAVAHIHGAGDNFDKIHGTVTFTQLAQGVKVVADVDGLSPGKHGIHIHENPDLSDAKLMNAGGHYNPDDADHRHAGPNEPKRHAGDLGNIDVNDNGHGHLELTDDDLSVDGPKNAVVGHSVIIHASEDDLKSQPAGNSGARIAGGVIVLKAGHDVP